MFNASTRCKRRACPGYVDIWMGDQGVRLLENLLSYRGNVVMWTVTAPGADLLPWACEPGDHLGKCSGPRGCRVEARAARQFNEGAMRRWSAVWDSLRTHCYRQHGPGALRLLAYAPEPQERGVIHFHIVIGAETARELAALHTASSRLQATATAHGWGSVDTNGVHGALWEAGRAAAYVSKYMMNPEKSKSVRALVVDGQAPTRAVYVANWLTKTTRCTMRNLRLRRYAHGRCGVRPPLVEIERWHREHRLGLLWDHCKTRPSTTWSRVTDGDPLHFWRDLGSPATDPFVALAGLIG